MSCTTVTKTMRKERFEVYVKGLTKDERKAFKTIKRHYNAIKGAQTRLKKMKIAAAKKNAIAERKAEREKAKLERELKKKCRPLLLELKKKLVPILKAKRQLKRLQTAKAKKEAVAKRKAERELEREAKKKAKIAADAAKAERKQAKEAAKAEKEAAKAEKEANKPPTAPAQVKTEVKAEVDPIVMPPTPPASPDAQPEPEGDELMKQLEELLPSPKEEDEGRANWEQNFAKLMATITVDETEYDVVKPNKEPVYNEKKSVYNKPKGKAPKDIAMWHAEAGVWLKERA